ncbi:MAG: methylmalonyl Co-A mutase-associated GTPase MeaB [Anaerolineales bacterium]|nr:methylmalonyl Co-A mutase-associated GTPase MeaB [Anaerolineales bacterium]MCS7247905.1 methylmalonyl Co-A mutase-associated GTPase MeaB [Anaerolineales bacterium]MDW8161715.1 methylmalonyl Co-A mutase-associated GTPase MeaB [Anaerolineales bacterium]MDW8447213.1 methylmalonyl Co-A mutase-associated GTPase MeaB [Anaerolineales bacterium]
MSLAESVLQGNRLALARLLSQVENETEEGLAELNRLFPYTGKAHLVGITGAPGSGKSSLVTQLVYALRHPAPEQKPVRVAVVAVDPSSPFSGGAILGDRIRMRELAGDQGVFIRSMASRGALGGVAASTANLVSVLDAAGFEIVLIETVGAGQTEVEIARLAHTVIVVEVPGLGDDVQAIKAGLLEIADIIVLNKADQPGVENAERALRTMLELASARGTLSGNAQPASPQWTPPLLRTVATEGRGVQAVVEALYNHRNFLCQSGEWERRERLRFQTQLENLFQAALIKRLHETVSATEYGHILDRIVSRQISPWKALEILLDGVVQ